MLSKIIYSQLFSLLSWAMVAQAPPTEGGGVPTVLRKDTTRLLQELVVTGTFKPIGLDKCVIPTRNIHIEKLATLGVQNVGDVLKFQSNFRIQQDPILGTGLSLQGVSGENIKILVDGVPVIGRQNGGIDLSQLNLMNVERIEVVEGPLSVQYGTNALAGTINIITKKSPTKGTELSVNNYYESVGHMNVGGAFGWRGDNQTLMVSAGRNFFGGWSDNNIETPSRFQSWKPKIQYFADAQYNFRVGDIKFGYAGNFFDEFILNRGRPLAPYNETAFDDNYKTQRFSNSFKANYTTKNQFIVNGLFSYNQYQRIKNTYYRDLVNLTQVLTQNEGDQDTSRFDLIAARGTVAKASDGKLSYETGFDINVETGTGLRIQNRQQEIGDYAAFAAAEWCVTEGVTLRPGLRASYNTSYKAPVIPSLHIRWKLPNKWTARASWGRGFRAPSLKELYFYFVDINHNIVGNQNLKAESSDNINVVANYLSLGKKNDKNIYKFEVSGFYNDIRNLISLAILRGGDNAYTYVNIDKFKTLGGQFLGEVTYGSLYLGIGGALTRRINRFDNQSFSANTWEWRATGVYNNIAQTGFDLNVWYKYSGAVPGFIKNEDGGVQNTFIGAYNMADLGLSRRFWKNRINFSTGCRNLFDVRNITAQIAGGAHSSGANTAALATGRNFFTKIEIKL
ncbi:MAG: TonB-dependent receptor [Saprospiraceae bacterium]|nr:TonB-dependent receptor [Saprospiraceae bacterium]